MSALNPYSASAKRKIAVASRSGVPLGLGEGVEVPRGQFGVTRGGTPRVSNQPLVARGGEFNAGNKREVMQAIATLHGLFQTGEVEAKYIDMDQDQIREVRAARAARVEEAYAAGPRSEAWKALGEVIGDEIWITLGREGFSRKTLLMKPLGKGETGRLRVRKKDVVAFFVTADPNVVASQVRQYYVYPPEFYLLANILIEDKEIEQASGDILDDRQKMAA